MSSNHTSSNHASNDCQLCGANNLERFEVPEKLLLWYCRGCDLYQNGQLPEDSAYEAEYHSGYERNRDSKLKTASIRLNRIAPLVKAAKPRLLDVGCSVGCVIEAANKRNWEGVGVDVSHDAVNSCNDRNLTSHHSNGVHLPFEDNSFDVVTAWHVIEHVQDVRETLAEWRRVLRPGGVLAMETPDGSSPKVRIKGADYRKFWAAEHTYTFSPKNLEQFVSEAGFQLARRPVFGRLTNLSASMASYAVVYQTYHGIRRLAGVHKAFQVFAHKTEQAVEKREPEKRRAA